MMPGGVLGTMGKRSNNVMGNVNLPFSFAGFIPLAFLGLGVYRAWIEIVFVGSFVDFPAAHFATRDFFDIVMSSVLLGCALGARKISPFFSKRAPWAISLLLLTAATACVFASIYFPDVAFELAIAASIAGGVGIALMILIWSELYGCLNPLRVAFYYAGSIIVGAVVIYIYRGFMIPWLFVMTSILPLASLTCAYRSFNLLSSDNLPSSNWAKFSVPWKIIALMAIYAFAYGLLEKYLYVGQFGPHSAFGTVAAALVVMVGVVLQGKNFDFAVIYRTALPLMAGALILPSAFGLVDNFWGNFCATGAYTAFSILTMLILANICYRYGVSAIWLFGIERGVRALFMMLGRYVEQGLNAIAPFGVNDDLITSGVALIAIIAGTMILLSERELASRWGAKFLYADDNDPVEQKHALVDRCDAIAKDKGLSAREQEVLLLLAQHKTISDIEKELIVANGTVKAHVRHIYQKLGIHSREELFEVLEAPKNGEAPKGKGA